MKKFAIMVLSILALSLPGSALQTDIWLSSNTATADTTQNLCKGQNFLVGTSTVTEGGHGILHGVCINSGAPNGTFTVYNSSGTASNPIAAVQTSTMTSCNFYDVLVSTGLTYSNSSTANVSILYQCY